MQEIGENLVYIVDDCEKVRDGLSRLLESAGYRVVGFDSAEAFLAASTENYTCLILDVKMPGASGPELQELLNRMGRTMHIVFLSGHADVHTSVEAMKRGAVDFLEKPVSSQTLLDAVALATSKMRAQQEALSKTENTRNKFNGLTPREKQVMTMVVSGYPNKRIAAELGLHEQTVKQHRGSVMRKMNADSLADLVRMSADFGQSPS